MKTLLLGLLFVAAAVEASAQTVSTVNSKPMPLKLVSASPNPNAITPIEWQELRAAHEAAVKANPALLNESAEMAQKMRNFQHKVDQAILQQDPSVSDVVTRIESGSARPQVPKGPTSPVPNSAPAPPASQ